MTATLTLAGAQTIVPTADAAVATLATTFESEMIVDVDPTNPRNIVGFSHSFDHAAGPTRFNTVNVFHSHDGGQHLGRQRDQ